MAWKKADDLAVAVYAATKACFPPEERYALRAQLRSASVSVASNIAEGAGRETLADFRRFLFQARGSLMEVENLIHLSRRLGYLREEEQEGLEAQRAEVGRVLSSLIRWAGKAMAEGQVT